jgi:hypothetical protein
MLRCAKIISVADANANNNKMPYGILQCAGARALSSVKFDGISETHCIEGWMVKVPVHILRALLSRWSMAVKCRQRRLAAPMLKTSSAYRSLNGVCYRPA